MITSNQLLPKDGSKPGKDNAPSGGRSMPSRTIVHPKLEMTTPESEEEKEADAVASDIMAGGKLARSISGGGQAGGIAVSSQMESQLGQLQGQGQPMPEALRGMMERGFGRDFSQVRLHTDGTAAEMSSIISAKAFTHGNDIYFGHGQYSPSTTEGQQLVAHELTHVAQGNGKVAREEDPKSILEKFFKKKKFDHTDNHGGEDIAFKSSGDYEGGIIDCDVYAKEAIRCLEQLGNRNNDNLKGLKEWNGDNNYKLLGDHKIEVQDTRMGKNYDYSWIILYTSDNLIIHAALLIHEHDRADGKEPRNWLLNNGSVYQTSSGDLSGKMTDKIESVAKYTNHGIPSLYASVKYKGENFYYTLEQNGASYSAKRIQTGDVPQIHKRKLF